MMLNQIKMFFDTFSSETAFVSPDDVAKLTELKSNTNIKKWERKLIREVNKSIKTCARLGLSVALVNLENLDNHRFYMSSLEEQTRLINVAHEVRDTLREQGYDSDLETYDNELNLSIVWKKDED